MQVPFLVWKLITLRQPWRMDARVVVMSCANFRLANAVWFGLNI